jgi:biopolymer transport protein ExbB/TolQ
MLHVPQIHGAGLSDERLRLWPTYSRPLIVLACLAGAALIIQLIDLLLPASWAVTLLDRTRSTYPLTVQNLTWLAFGLGVGELIVRARDARAERAELHKGYLPEDETTVLQAPELRRIYARARASGYAISPAHERFLPRLIHRVVTQFQTSRSVDQANALLNSSLELFLHEIDLRYSLVRYIIWVIPALGFIGTVMGISLALAYAGAVDLQDPSLLSGLTQQLAVAFDTTLLALVLSAVLVLIQHVVQAYEERSLNQVGQYCLDNLINRLYTD